MMRYRKKPVVIEAMQLDHSPARSAAIIAWASAAETVIECEHDGAESHVLRIPTREGVMTAQPGDWVIKGVAGEFYPCKPEIFAATYEAVE